ncbi:uridine kinase family protein [Coprothermobacter platensis]|uniref:uridine kinase family protein n=1 Tax=Coprothermobacter platensis TaxID=108819 RepID=UPI00035CE00E|nr:nucleoside kinase [Coprothermobacter platensis]
MVHYLSVEGLFKCEVEDGQPFWDAISTNEQYRSILEKEEAVAIHLGKDILPLQAPVKTDGAVRLVRRDSVLGQRIVEKMCLFLVGMAAYRLFGEKYMEIKYSYGSGIFCSMEQPLKDSEVDALNNEVEKLIEKNVPISWEPTSLNSSILSSSFVRGKSSLLKYPKVEHQLFYSQGYGEISWLPILPSSGMVRKVNVINYTPGFVVVPEGNVFEEIPKLFQAFFEYDQWLNVLGIRDVGDINALVQSREIIELIKVAEALHEKRISYIADEISKREAKLVLIAGPSSSGKTSFSKRLSIQLRVNGLRPVYMGTDDYFVPRDLTPKDENGNYDFDSLNALDLQTLVQDINKLLNGEEIEVKKYDFVKGVRIIQEKKMRLPSNGVLVLEGIHALNPKTTLGVPAHVKYKIYVSALAHLNLDEVNRTYTTDARLVRRMVRDSFYRAYLAEETLRQWPLVRRGEDRNIFPYQQEADAFFNSALPYELLVLKPFAEPMLQQIPETLKEYADAWRLKRLLSYFDTCESAFVPNTSILREFVGGSAFDVY